MSLCRKYQINGDWGQNKSKGPLYKEITVNIEQTFEQKKYEVLFKPTIKIYCDECLLEVTRVAHVITKLQYYCVGCFAKFEEEHDDYIIRRSLKQSLTQSQWQIMDQICLITAYRLWGFGNMTQIKEYMDYNCSPFTVQQIEQHFQKYYMHNEETLLNFDIMVRGQKKKTFTQLCQQMYLIKNKNIQLQKRQSKGEKKPVTIQSFSSKQIQSQRQIKLQNTSRNNLQNKKQKGVLGYNMKRGQFQNGQYDLYAEHMLNDLQFYEDDTEEEFQLKMKIIEEYNKRQTQRLKRRAFTLSYKLLDNNYNFHQPHEQITPKFLPYMRFTQNYQNFRSVIDDYAKFKQNQIFLTNLLNISKKGVKQGTIENTFNFLKRKKHESIEKWQKKYNKKYDQQKRNIYSLQMNIQQIIQKNKDIPQQINKINQKIKKYILEEDNKLDIIDLGFNAVLQHNYKRIKLE